MRMLLRHVALVWTLSLAMPMPASAQLIADTTFSWRGYARVSTCRIRVFRSAPKAKRSITVVVDELADNRGRSTLDDAPHLVELAGRSIGVPPDSAYWIFHWGAFSFRGAEPERKELFLRATFRQNDTGALSPPFWRLITRETVLEYTDRAFR